MKQRKMDEMISYFNQQVDKMDIDRKYKMALLGMITAIGYENKKQERKWTPCSERLPDENGDYLVTGKRGAVDRRRYEDGRWYGGWSVLAWMPLPEPWRGEEYDMG